MTTKCQLTLQSELPLVSIWYPVSKEVIVLAHYLPSISLLLWIKNSPSTRIGSLGLCKYKSQN
jgi:hypothetical protein